jgi:aminoglycoside phosphotransferase family enzyme/predicted kinase
MTLSSAGLSTPPRSRRATRLPAGLLDPAAFPHRPDEVELRETHVSWVFLAGERAYKVKKPVVLSFLDYGTLERRRACCAEEVRINRRLGRSVYAGVVALVPHGPDGLAVAPEHDPRAVEYAVEMRRYDEDATLASALADGRARERDLAAIGAALARFHAERPPETGGAGTDRLVGVVEETLATLTRAAAETVEPARLAALARFARSAVAGFAPRLRAREAAGLVRDGHGDLRAEHILLSEPIEMVDAVDFDPALRIIDVAYDLAFLVMDVARRDESLARALVRGYTTAGGDAGDESLLEFLVVVRALVRAKIDLLRAAQLDDADRDERVDRALGLVALAERFAWRARLPRVVCVAGLAASGKSTLAAALSDATGLPVISSDLERKTRAGLEPHAHAGPAHYTRDVSREVYGALGRAAAAAARDEGGAIVDATFRRSDDLAAFTGAARAAAGAGWIVCRAPADVLLERARWRAAAGSTDSDADPAVVATQIARAGERLPLPCAPLAELDTVHAVPRLLSELATALDARLALANRRKPQVERGRFGTTEGARATTIRADLMTEEQETT